MSNSPLTSLTILSPNFNARGDNIIDRITVHHMAGNMTIESCGEMFARPERQASSNYGVGSDGRIAMYVPEDCRAWTTGSRDNDYRAITIEVANDGGPLDSVSEAALRSLIDLMVDICVRNPTIGDLRWNPSESMPINPGNLTIHRWYQSTDCPGIYIYHLLGWIAAEVNRRVKAVRDSFYKVVAHRSIDMDDAKRISDELTMRGIDNYVRTVNGRYVVQAGAYQMAINAVRQCELIRQTCGLNPTICSL